MRLRRLFSLHNICLAIVGASVLAGYSWMHGTIANAQSGTIAQQGATAADEKTWEPHDLNRPKPVIRDPGPGTENEFAKPPNDAIVLFDGKDLSQWVRRPGAKEQPPVLEPKWKVVDGYFEVVPNSGSIYTKEKFEDCRIHVEWATPASFKPQAKGQNRGNSGLFLLGHPELQVLDSFDNETYADGQAAAIYGKVSASI